MKVLFTGLGSIGQRHLRNLRHIMGNSIDVTNDGDTYSAEYSITEDDSGLVIFSIDF